MDSTAASTSDVDLESLRATVSEALSAMLEFDVEPFPGAKSIFPKIWCEWASVAISEVLSDRELGEWTFVSAGREDSSSGHSWLELRDANGLALVTIDATLHQFEEWDAPFVGDGTTPAKSVFTQPRYSGHWTRWPETERNSSYETYASAFSAYLAR